MVHKDGWAKDHQWKISWIIFIIIFRLGLIRADMLRDKKLARAIILSQELTDDDYDESRRGDQNDGDDEEEDEEEDDECYTATGRLESESALTLLSLTLWLLKAWGKGKTESVGKRRVASVSILVILILNPFISEISSLMHLASNLNYFFNERK